MKDSGIEWVGMIPDGWGIRKLFYCLRQPICDGPHETPNLIETGIPFISIDSLNETKHVDFSSVRKFISEIDYARYMEKANLEEGDILFTKAATIGKTAIVGNERFMVWSPIAIIKANETVVIRDFLYYLLNCNELIISIGLSGSYNTQVNVGMRDLEKAKIPLPDISQQKLISKLLDEKCSSIASAINGEYSLIEKLKEYRQAVITEAVTKGLDKNAKMKDSGVEWIGEIPEGWTVCKSKSLFRKRNERGNKITLQLLSPTQKYGVIPQELYEELSGMGAVKLKEETNLLLLKTIHIGDFCISLRSFQGGFEYSKYEGVVSPAYNVFFLSRDGCNGYYRYLFKERSFIDKISSYTLTLRDGKMISFEDFGVTLIPHPPLHEQQKIAAYLDKKCAAIDKAISDREAVIEKLEEYKKSLIYEYVTGKKEVAA